MLRDFLFLKILRTLFGEGLEGTIYFLRSLCLMS